MTVCWGLSLTLTFCHWALSQGICSMNVFQNPRTISKFKIVNQLNSKTNDSILLGNIFVTFFKKLLTVKLRVDKHIVAVLKLQQFGVLNQTLKRPKLACLIPIILISVIFYIDNVGYLIRRYSKNIDAHAFYSFERPIFVCAAPNKLIDNWLRAVCMSRVCEHSHSSSCYVIYIIRFTLYLLRYSPNMY